MELEGILPCTFHPFDDELFSSWIIRLSHAHRLSYKTFCKFLFNSYNILNRDIDNIASDEILMSVAARTLTPIQKIRQATLKGYEGKLFLKHAPNNTKWILPYDMRYRARNLRGLLFCPSCLKKDGHSPYYRKHWRLSFSITCTSCNVYLQDQCPSCFKPIVLFRNDIDIPISHCYHCSYDLASSHIVGASTIDIYNQKHLNMILRQGLNKQVIYPHLYFDVLYQLLKLIRSNRKLSKVLRADLLNRLEDIKFSQQNLQGDLKHNMIELAIENRSMLLKAALWILKDYPIRLISLFKSHNFKSADLLNDFPNAPFWFDKIVIENFQYKSHRKHERITALAKDCNNSKRKFSSFYSCKICYSNWVIKEHSINKNHKLRCLSCGTIFILYSSTDSNNNT